MRRSEGPAILGIRPVEEPGPLEHTGEAHHVAGILGSALFHPLTRQDGEGGEGDDVLPIVVEHPLQRARVAPAHVVEVDLRDQLTGDVSGTPEPKERRLQRLQPARLEPHLPKAPGGMEQVEVRGRAQRKAGAVQPEARVEEREVEHLAVEGDEASGSARGRRRARGGARPPRGSRA